MEEEHMLNKEQIEQLKKHNLALTKELEEVTAKVKDTETDISNKKINISADTHRSNKVSKF